MTTFKRSFTDRDLSPIIGGEKREGGTGPIKKSHEVVISSRWRGGGAVKGQEHSGEERTGHFFS